jgi:hypothetical protein
LFPDNKKEKLNEREQKGLPGLSLYPLLIKNIHPASPAILFVHKIWRGSRAMRRGGLTGLDDTASWR